MHYCSLCLIVRDDHRYIREWISYYSLLGVDHFYITDNLSEPPLNETLSDLIEKGLVTYQYDTRRRPQITVYNECLSKYRQETRWMAFFDSDEFLVLKQHDFLKDFLQNYEAYGAVSVCWVYFGSNGHDQKQDSILLSYTQRCPETFRPFYKMIVQTTRVHRVGVHEVKLHAPPFFTVNERKQKVFGTVPSHPTIDVAQLNHYVLRSQEDFKDKMRRGGGIHPKGKDWVYFKLINQHATISDMTILTKLQQFSVRDNWIEYFNLKRETLSVPDSLIYLDIYMDV